MLREIFIDTAAWLALFDPRDTNHVLANTTYKSLLPRYTRIITTNVVVLETYTLLYRRTNYNTALKFLTNSAGIKKLTKLYSDEDLETRAESILRRYNDQDFSFVDAVSFAVMEDLNITTAFTFDHHFLIAGFTLAQASGRQ